ncbi:hypothetical protein [Limnohabitans sp. Bal53]|uniref:hypothetical protein n=1 Tax=Limnohabitans sp. Bal53 TaxID=1977910 RepID=UPI000D3BEB4B|nr:hypothetical protein [Limnohabitans sp. Bal53]PUE41683.1 hypothetical protein B9Z50_08395 [Limnohabitans sp. Bal53]
MKLGKGVPSVWPGYVAAVASLVLSLLLLLAILVFAMTQIENLVARYEQQLLRASLEQEVDASKKDELRAPTPTVPAPAPAPVLPKPTAEKPQAKDRVEAKTSKTDATLPDQIRLIFEAGVGDLSPEAAQELATLMARLKSDKPLYWVIQASTVAADPVMEKTSYRLIMKVNQLLRQQGVDEKRIQVRLQKSNVPPRGYADGEIVVTLEWHQREPQFKGQP